MKVLFASSLKTYSSLICFFFLSFFLSPSLSLFLCVSLCDIQFIVVRKIASILRLVLALNYGRFADATAATSLKCACESKISRHNHCTMRISSLTDGRCSATGNLHQCTNASFAVNCCFVSVWGLFWLQS